MRVSFFGWCCCGEIGSVVAHEGGEEGGRFGLAGVGGEKMSAVRRLVKTIACAVDVRGFGVGRPHRLDLHAYCAFEDVPDHRARMTMRWRGFAWTVAHLDHPKA